MSQHFDIGLVTENDKLIGRVTGLCKEFSCSHRIYKNTEEFLKNPSEQSVLITLAKDPKNPNLAAELAQNAKKVDPTSFVICGVEKTLPKEAAALAKKSGADLLLLEDELFTSSKLEFAITQTLQASFFPIKSADLVTGKELPFDLFHLMPQRKKYVQFVLRGSTLDKDRLAKIDSVGEVYIHRSQAPSYKKYIEALGDRTQGGLARKCRAQYLALHSQYSSLVLTLTDQSERASLGEGEKLLSTVRSICQDLTTTLAEFSAAWEIVNNSSIGEFGSVERAPAVAAYASVFSHRCGLQKIDEIMLVSLLVDLGIIFLTPETTKKIREDRFSELTPAELAAYKKYPNVSMDLVLDRKLSISEKMRSIFLAVHERADGRGFPKGLFAEKIPNESQMVQFCKTFDQRTLLRMGKPRPKPASVRDALVDEVTKNKEQFTESFIHVIQKGFKST